eukprot:4627521-Pleurochrysis_carterae.AAC.3
MGRGGSRVHIEGKQRSLSWRGGQGGRDAVAAVYRYCTQQLCLFEPHGEWLLTARRVAVDFCSKLPFFESQWAFLQLWCRALRAPLVQSLGSAFGAEP